MAECCIRGCPNKTTKRGELKFYTLPTAKSCRTIKIERRRLWLEALEKANGSIEGLKNDVQVCSAHFVSGQMSLDVSNQDFVPSLFPPPRKITRRDTLRPRPGVQPYEPTMTPNTRPVRKQFQVNYCEPIEDEELLEEEEKKENNENPLLATNQEITESPIEVPHGYPELKRPKLELKSVVARVGLFQCEVCNCKVSSGSKLVKHKKRHDQEGSDDESVSSVAKEVSEKSDFDDVSVPVEEPSFKCNMCNRSFPTIHNLKRHKLLHVRDARKCKQCGTMFCKRHNHHVAQPQISTDIRFEVHTVKEDKSDSENTENEMPGNSSSDEGNVDKSLELLLNSDHQTIDAIAAAQDQCVQDTQQKPKLPVTYSPRKPGLLTAFKTFLTKHSSPNIKTEEINLSNSCSTSRNAQNVENKQVTTTTAATTTNNNNPAIAPDASALSDNVSTTLTSNTTPTISTITTATHLPEQCSTEKLPLITSVNSLAPQAGKPLLIITTPPQSQLGQTHQNTGQSTVCVSFSKPLAIDVVKEFMSCINKDEIKSTAPQLPTFTSKPKDGALKQDQSSVFKLEPSTAPIQVTQIPHEKTPQKEEKKTYIMTILPKLPQNKTPATQKAVDPSIKAPLSSSSSSVSTVIPQPQLPNKAKRVNPSPINVVSPWKHYVHGSRPPSPVPFKGKIQSGPWDSPFPNYPLNFVQRHLPQTPVLPPALQMFSPQFLTSSFLEVKRDYDYILSK